jgi:hypothetical protein
MLWLVVGCCLSTIFSKTSSRILFNKAQTDELCTHYALDNSLFYVESVMDVLEFYDG